MILRCYISQCLWTAGHACQHFFIQCKESIVYYFSTHGCGCFWSSLSSASFDFEPLDAAAAAARALLLKKLAAIAGYGYLVLKKILNRKYYKGWDNVGVDDDRGELDVFATRTNVINYRCQDIRSIVLIIHIMHYYLISIIHLSGSRRSLQTSSFWDFEGFLLVSFFPPARCRGCWFLPAHHPLPSCQSGRSFGHYLVALQMLKLGP